MAGKERKLEKVMVHDPRPIVYQAVSVEGIVSRGSERGKGVGGGGVHPVQILLEKLGAVWFRNEEKGRLIAPGEEFSQWLTSDGGPKIQLKDIPHFEKVVDTMIEEKVIELCRGENEVIKV